MDKIYCEFDDGEVTCHATENDECPDDYDSICTAKTDIHGNILGIPDGCIDE